MGRVISPARAEGLAVRPTNVATRTGFPLSWGDLRLPMLGRIPRIRKIRPSATYIRSREGAERTRFGVGMEKNEEDDWWCWGVIGAFAVAASLAVWLPILILS